MIEELEMVLDAPTSWRPLPPAANQAASLARFAVHADDLSVTLSAWRAMAKDGAGLLHYAAPYPGYLTSPLRSLAGHPLQSLLPWSTPQAWLKCDNELPLSQSLSDRGMGFAVLSLISNAMMAAGMAHPGQPLMNVDKSSTRAWLSEHQLVIHGPGRDAVAAARICRVLGLPTQVILKGDTALSLKEALFDCGVDLSGPWPEAEVSALKRRASAFNSKQWWLDSSESFEAYQGYACAALELKQQLLSEAIQPSASEPLLVYVSSGNCLGAAALVRGLKGVFGSAVKAVLVEDSHRLQALPTLCRWPNDGAQTASSNLGCLALTGMVDSVITVDERQRKLAGLPLPEHIQAQYSSETIALFAAASEHLSQQPVCTSPLVIWMSDCALS